MEILEIFWLAPISNLGTWEKRNIFGSGDRWKPQSGIWGSLHALGFTANLFLLREVAGEPLFMQASRQVKVALVLCIFLMQFWILLEWYYGIEFFRGKNRDANLGTKSEVCWVAPTWWHSTCPVKTAYCKHWFYITVPAVSILFTSPIIYWSLGFRIC